MRTNSPIGLAPDRGIDNWRCFCFRARSFKGVLHTIEELACGIKPSTTVLACGFDTLDDMVEWLGRKNLKAVRMPDQRIVYVTRKMRGGPTGFVRAKNALGYLWQWTNENDRILEEIWLKRNGYEV